MFKFLNAIRNQDNVDRIEQFRVRKDEDFEEGGGVVYPPIEALRFAVMYSHLGYARHILHEYGESVLKATLCCPLLLLSVRLNDTAMLKLLCQESARSKNAGFANYVNARGCELMESGKTALHTAAELGHVQCVKILLQNGADSSMKDSTNMTSIENAVHKHRANLNNLRCCIELLKCEKHIQRELPPLLHMLHSRVHIDGVCNLCEYLPTNIGPVKLQQLCESKIRETLGRRLADDVHELPVPLIFKKSISFQDDFYTKNEY